MMTTTYRNLSFAMLAVTGILLLIFAIVQNVSATSSIRMLADLNPTNGGIADGKADYRERDNSKRLNVEVEDVSPNSAFTVKISGKTIGTIRTSSFGIGELELNTNDGQVVPTILKGDLVQIFQGTILVLSGGFDDDDEGNIEDEQDDDDRASTMPAQDPVTQAPNSGSAIATVITIPQEARSGGGAGAYSPDPASVSSGLTVTWNNIDDSPHTATADDGSFDTGIINEGSSGSAVISASRETRVIPYHCTLHPEMRGTLQVISLSTVTSSNSTLENASVTDTNSSNNNATIQNLQQAILALQQVIDSLQQTLMALQQSVPLVENATSADNNNNNTAASPIHEERQEPVQPPQQLQSQQQEQAQNVVGVSIVRSAFSLTDDAYEPNPVEINIGDTVTWTNDDATPHTVTSGANAQQDGRFDSGIMAPQETFEHTFTEEAGEYPYYCALHPNMVGTVNIVS